MMVLGDGGEGTVEVFLCASDGGEGPVVAVRVEPWGGVDLGLVGRNLGLDPSSVRLNGHYLSRGPRLVSTCVSWAALRSFFAARGLPSGVSHHHPIRVHGKPLLSTTSPGLSCPPDQANGSSISFKRKAGLQDEGPLKKNRATECNTSVPLAGHGQVSDDDCLSIKRKLRLEDDNPIKKCRTKEYTSGLTDQTPKLPKVSPRTGFTYSCITGSRKRLREDEMVAATSSKRVK